MLTKQATYRMQKVYTYFTHCTFPKINEIVSGGLIVYICYLGLYLHHTFPRINEAFYAYVSACRRVEEVFCEVPHY